MKYLLGINNDISGYINLGIRKNIEESIPTSSAMEIKATSYLDFIPPEIFEKTVETLCSRLTCGGNVAIVMTDLFSVANMLVDGQISLVDYRETIYGTNESPNRYVCWTMDNVCNLLIKNNVIPNKKWYNGHQMNIVGVKI